MLYYTILCYKLESVFWEMFDLNNVLNKIMISIYGTSEEHNASINS